MLERIRKYIITSRNTVEIHPKDALFLFQKIK